MGTQRVQMKGVLPWLVRWTRRAGTIDFCHALAALVSPVQNIIFLTSTFYSPGQAGVLGRLSLCQLSMTFTNLHTVFLTNFDRYAVATKDIPVGSTLLVEQPITWALHPDR
jgi:hypothetical protein